jgi:hypothetical protein
MKNKSPYLIGQRTLALLDRIEMDGMYAEDAIENDDWSESDPELYGRYKLMVELGRELGEALDADELAAQIDPQLG